MVKPGDEPSALVWHSRRRAEVHLSVNAVPLLAVNPRAHDEIDRALEPAAQNLVVRRRIAAPRVVLRCQVKRRRAQTNWKKPEVAAAVLVHRIESSSYGGISGLAATDCGAVESPVEESQLECTSVANTLIAHVRHRVGRDHGLEVRAALHR